MTEIAIENHDEFSAAVDDIAAQPAAVADAVATISSWGEAVAGGADTAAAVGGAVAVALRAFAAAVRGAMTDIKTDTAAASVQVDAGVEQLREFQAAVRAIDADGAAEVEEQGRR